MGCQKSKQEVADQVPSGHLVGGSEVVNEVGEVVAESKSEVVFEPPPLPEINLSGLDSISRLEFSLPFYRVKIETLEKRLKKASGNEKKSFTLE